MDANYVSGVAALAGSGIGALSSFATTWLIHNSATRIERIEKTRTRQESLYGEFIDEASRLFADAITHDMGDPAQVVKLYSLVSRMRLAASDEVVAQAEHFLIKLIEVYNSPNLDTQQLKLANFDTMDTLKDFSRTCRKELFSA